MPRSRWRRHTAASLDEVTAAGDAAVAPRDWLTSLGLDGGDPDGDLAAARAAWQAGDLDASTAAAGDAVAALGAAPGNGRTKVLLVGGGAIAIVMLLWLVIVIRRRRNQPVPAPVPGSGRSVRYTRLMGLQRIRPSHEILSAPRPTSTSPAPTPSSTRRAWTPS